DIARKALEEVNLDEKSLFSVGTIDGFRSFDELKDPSTALPENRTAGATMHYTSGTTGKPKGVRRPLGEIDPDTAFGMASLLLSPRRRGRSTTSPRGRMSSTPPPPARSRSRSACSSGGGRPSTSTTRQRKVAARSSRPKSG